MIRGLYTTKSNQQRLLSIDEIASACCISSQKVKGWVTGNLLKPAPTGEHLIEASEIVSFLARNGMPVSPALLPPKTRKILFIATDLAELHQKEGVIDHICSIFTKTCNIMAEVSSAGRTADLTILTITPDVVVIFLRTYNKSTVNTFNLLASMPGLKTILFVDEETKNANDAGQLALPGDLVFSENTSPDQLTIKLQPLFEN